MNDIWILLKSILLGAVKLAITSLGRLLLKTKQRYETKQRPSAFREEMKK